MAEDNVEVKIGANIADLKKGMDDAKSSVEEFVSGAKEFAEVVGVMFAVDKIREFVVEMSSVAEQIERISTMTGLSTDVVESFQNAIQLTGGDAENAGVSLLRLERNMATAASQGGPLADAFRRAGVSAQTLASGNVQEALSQIADKFHDTADGANKVEVAMQLAGRGGASLIPFLDLGSAGFEELNQKIESTNSQLTELQDAGLAQTSRDMFLLSKSSEGIAAQLSIVLNPAIQAAITAFTLMNEQFSQSIKEGGQLHDAMEFLGKGIVAVVLAVDTMKSGWIEAYDVISGLIKGLVDYTIGWGEAIYDVLHGKLAQGVVDFSVAFGKASDDIKKGFADGDAQAQKLLDDTIKIMAVAEGASGGLAPKSGHGKGSQIEGAASKDDKGKSLSEQRSLYAEDYAVKKEFDDLKVQSTQLTHRQEYDDLSRQLNLQKTLTDASFDQEMGQYKEGSDAYQKLVYQKMIADQKFAVEHLKLTQEMVKFDAEETKKETKQWLAVSDTISKSFDTMLNGVLQGTQTMQQAFQHLAQNIVLSFIEAVAKSVIQIGVLKAASAAGFSVGSPASAGASGGGVFDMLATNILSLIGVTTIQDVSVTANTTAMAALTAAVTANTAAQGAGGAGGGIGQVLGLAGELAAFDVGTSYVPATMPALIHKGEMIIPADQSAAIRGGQAMIGGGGPIATRDSGSSTSVHFNISAMDGASVKSMLANHGKAIAGAVMAAARNGHNGFSSAMARS